jgi:hypothetical protein
MWFTGTRTDLGKVEAPIRLIFQKMYRIVAHVHGAAQWSASDCGPGPPRVGWPALPGGLAAAFLVLCGLPQLGTNIKECHTVLIVGHIVY